VSERQLTTSKNNKEGGVKVNKDRYDEDRSGKKIWSSKVERFNGGKARWESAQ
jgi:hypothetical protein